MGFKTVYRCLMDVFPKVDSRILKAVAIEHPKDADAAAEVVLCEVLPYLSTHSMVFTPPCEDLSSSVLLEEAKHEEQNDMVRDQQVGLEKSVGSSSEPRSVVKADAIKIDLTSGVNHSDSTHQQQGLNPETALSCDTNLDNNQLQGNVESKESMLLGKPQNQEDNIQSASSQISTGMSNALVHEDNVDHSQVCANAESEMQASSVKCQEINVKAGHEQVPQVMSTSLIQENGGCNGNLTGHHGKCGDYDGPAAIDFTMVMRGESSQVEIFLDSTALEEENSVIKHTPDAAEGGVHAEFSSNPINDCENVNNKEDSKIELLEEIIEAAKNNKRTLFLAMELVLNMMKQVDLQEKAAEQAKQEAASGGLDSLVKVEELKQMLAHAKEANDMHAGEVYGEKAILATEVRELQSRLLSLSDERDKALAILDEMHQTLEARLAAAEELKKAAEQEKLEKEEAAQNALAEQEAIMKKVVQESKFLLKEAEENAKLQEFLIDRGHVVDALQGEISVICQDVRLLKENFDEHVPLSKSISSSQTSCILASSGSSLKSMASDLVPEQFETSKSPEETSPAPSVHGQSPCRSPSSSFHGQSPRGRPDNKVIADHKELLDEGWEFFEKDTEM